jgi:hypothetical protein
MLIDIGASWKAKRGDLNFIYESDKSIDNRHAQYDAMFPLNLEPYNVVYYKSIDRIINDIYLLPDSNSLDILFLHSLEHFYNPIYLVHKLFAIRPRSITIIGPNAQTNLADCRDSGHLIAFTECSLKNLAEYLIKNDEEYTYTVDKLMDNQDLMLRIFHAENK